MLNRYPNRLNSVRFFASISFLFVSIVTLLCGVFAYHVSPLRDPSFIPNSANAGSLILPGVHEGDWMVGAMILAAMLSANLTLLAIVSWWRRYPLKQQIFAPAIVWLLVWLGLAFGFWVAFVLYLMAQWLID